MRPVVKYPCPEKPKGTKKVFSPYDIAKPDLVDNLGDFCSYCDWQVNIVALEVEHVDDKHNNPGKMESWDNFLLACKNCNTIKGTKPINYSTMLFPHIQNTYEIFTYLNEGVISINNKLDQGIQLKVQNMINLVGLDRDPSHAQYSFKDKRWEYRMIVWRKANEYLNDYRNGDIKIKSIIDLALARGFWSVWMQVFKGEAVEDKLIATFKGTYQDCRTKDPDRA